MRKEIPFQNHIMDSYEAHGGKARKWATELQVGVPDLICSLPVFGVHLAEVKHRPEFGCVGKMVMPNPLAPKQVSVAREFINGGGLVVMMVVAQSEKALGSWLYMFDPLCLNIDATGWVPRVPYVPGRKFNVRGLLEFYLERAKS